MISIIVQCLPQRMSLFSGSNTAVFRGKRTCLQLTFKWFRKYLYVYASVCGMCVDRKIRKGGRKKERGGKEREIITYWRIWIKYKCEWHVLILFLQLFCKFEIISPQSISLTKSNVGSRNCLKSFSVPFIINCVITKKVT